MLAFQGDAARRLGQVGGGGGIPGDLFNGRGHLGDGGGGLLDLAMLLLQVAAALGSNGIQFLGRCRQLARRAGYLPQCLHQVITHGLLCPQQACGFVIAGRVDGLAEIALGDGFSHPYRLNDGAGDAAGQQPGHQHRAATYQHDDDGDTAHGMLVRGHGSLAGKFCALVGEVDQLIEVLGHLLIAFSNAVEKVTGASLVT